MLRLRTPTSRIRYRNVFPQQVVPAAAPSFAERLQHPTKHPHSLSNLCTFTPPLLALGGASLHLFTLHNTMKKTQLHAFTTLLLLGSLQWISLHHLGATTPVIPSYLDTIAPDTVTAPDTLPAPLPVLDSAQVARKQARKDSLMRAYTLETFKERLNRREQLAILDSYMPDQIDFQALLRSMIDTLDSDRRYELMTSVYRRANMPVPALEPVAKIYWKDIEHNFGVLPQGRVVKHTFEFTNIGDIPYQIEEIEGSCGCTIASYPKESILPGQKGAVVVTFDSAGKSGENTELVTVVGNSYPERVVLLINATVR